MNKYLIFYNFKYVKNGPMLLKARTRLLIGHVRAGPRSADAFI